MNGFLGTVGRILAQDEVPQPEADPSGFPLEDALLTVLNVLYWGGLAASVGGVIVGGAILAIAQVTSNTMWGSKGKTMALMGLLGAVVVASAGQLVQWAQDLA